VGSLLALNPQFGGNDLGQVNGHAISPKGMSKGQT
jgi:hypothetical protein